LRIDLKGNWIKIIKEKEKGVVYPTINLPSIDIRDGRYVIYQRNGFFRRMLSYPSRSVSSL
jgi:hypothetical protein